MTNAQKSQLVAFLALAALERRGARIAHGDVGEVRGYFGPWCVKVEAWHDRSHAALESLDEIQLHEALQIEGSWSEAVEALREVESIIGVIWPAPTVPLEGFDVSQLNERELVATVRDINATTAVRAVLVDGVVERVEVQHETEKPGACAWGRVATADVCDLAAQLGPIMELVTSTGGAPPEWSRPFINQAHKEPLARRPREFVAKSEPTLCPWLTMARSGTIIIDGRAKFPIGYVPPTSEHGFVLVWRFEGGLWHFRGEGRGSVLDASNAIEQNRWFDGHVMRVDGVTCRASSRLEADDYTSGADLEVDQDGRLVAAVLSDVEATDEDRAWAEKSMRAVFGEALRLGPWERFPSGWRAAVALGS